MEYIQKCVGQIEMSQYAMLDTETSFVFTTLIVLGQPHTIGFRNIYHTY